MAYNVSNEYNEVIYSEDAKHKLKLLFNGVEYTDSNIKTEYVKVKSNILSSGEERFSLDNFVSKEAEIVIHDIDLEDIVAPISISIGTLVDEDNDTYEYVPIGIFNIDETPTTDNGVTTIKLKDNAVKFDFPYDGSEVIEEHDGEATMLQILQDICEKAGVDLETTDFINKDTKVSVWDNSINARVYVMYISEKAGCIATISRDGKLQLINLQRGDLLEETINTQSTIENVLEIDKIKELSGNTSQASYTGKNLCGIPDQTVTKSGVTITIKDGEITLNGTSTGSLSYITPIDTTTLSGNYSLNVIYLSGSMSGSTNRNFNVRKASDNSNIFGTTFQTSNSYNTHNFTSSTQIIFGIYGANTAKFTNYKFKVQLVQGTSSDYNYEPYVGGTTSPSPEYPQSIENVTGLQNIEVCGKNLFNKDNIIKLNGTIDNSNTFTGGGLNYAVVINCKPNTTYTVQKRNDGNTNRFALASSETIPSSTGGEVTPLLNRIREDNSLSLTLTTGATAKYLIIQYYRSAESVLTEQQLLDSIQAEIGSTATTYEPYTGNTYEVNLGKNLFDKDSGFRLGYINASGNFVSSNQTACFNQYIPCKPNTTYTISFNTTMRSVASPLYYDKNKTFLSRATATDNIMTKTITTPKNCYYMVIQFNYDGSSTMTQEIIDSVNCQLEVGSQATSYSPYFTPIELNKIGDYKDSINKSTGKNLFDKDNYSVYDGYFYSTSVYSGASHRTLYLKIEGGKTYTVQKLNKGSNKRFSLGTAEIQPETGTGKDINAIGNTPNADNLTITARENDKYLYIWCYVTNDTEVTWQQILDSIMINESSTALPYEPYGKVWYVEKKIKNLTLNGSENWHFTSGERERFTTDINDIALQPFDSSASIVAISNYFSGTTWYKLYNNTSINNALSSHNAAHQLNIRAKQFNGNTDNFKTWLTNNLVEVIYITTEPYIEKITNEELINQLEAIQLLKGTNNISITSGDLSATIDVSYYEEKQPIELNPLLMESYKEGEKLQISRVVYEDAIRKFEYGNEDNGTLYINSANPYIKNTTEIEKIYNSINGFNIYSMNISKMIGNPALDPWDLIGFTWNNKTYKTLAQNTLTFNGKITQSFDTQIGTNAKTQENVTLNTDVSKFRKVSTEINQLNGTITMVAGEVDENTQRITTVEQDVNEIKQTAISYEDLIRNKQQVRMLHIENAFPNYPLKLSIKNASLVFPNNNLYPSNTLYTKDSYLIVDKTEQLSENAKMYHLPLTKLYVKDGVYDEFVVEKKNMYVIHRIGVNNDNTTYILDNEVIEDLGTIDIELFKGDNYIYLYSFQNDGVIYEITYTIPSEFTNVFATEVYVDSSIEQTANQILLQVNEKVDENEIIAKLNVAVEDGQGIVNLVGNTVTIDSDNFQLDADGKIKSTAGEIGGFNIMPETLDSPIYPIRKRLIDGEYVEEEFEIYSDEFCEAIREIIQSGRTPTQEELDLYDLNHNGRIDSGDYYLAKSTQIYNISKDKPGKFSINTKSVNNVLTIYDKDENERVNLGMLAMDFKNLNGDKANIAPGGFSLSNSNQISNAVLGTGNGYALLNLYGDDSSFISANASSSPTLIVKASGTQTYIDNTQVQANAFVNTSLESKKKNISKVKNGLDILKNIDIYTYNYKDEIKSEKIDEPTKISKKAIQQPTKKHYGVVIGDDYNYSSEITDSKNEGVDLYSFISVCCASIKEQQEQIEELQKEIKLLKEEK